MPSNIQLVRKTDGSPKLSSQGKHLFSKGGVFFSLGEDDMRQLRGILEELLTPLTPPKDFDIKSLEIKASILEGPSIFYKGKLLGWINPPELFNNAHEFVVVPGMEEVAKGLPSVVSDEISRKVWELNNA